MFKNPESRRDFKCFIDVVVKKSDLAKGTYRRPDSCPVAHALSRGISRRFRRWNVTSVSIGNSFAVVRVHSKSGIESYELIAQLPRDLVDLIHSVDDQRGGTPGTTGTLEFTYNRTFYGDQA